MWETKLANCEVTPQAAVGSQRLTAWAMARPWRKIVATLRREPRSRWSIWSGSRYQATELRTLVGVIMICEVSSWVLQVSLQWVQLSVQNLSIVTQHVTI
jgi:hypothetical protein